MQTESDRFRTVAQHYLQGRPAYAAALVRRVAQLCGLDRSCRLLDLGCGPGQLALAFAPYVGQVLAIDPEPEMLRIARQQAAAAVGNIEFREGSSRDLGPGLGGFRLAVIGRAFHWMDRQDTLRRLDQLLEPDGAVALFHDDHPRVPDNRWVAAYEALIDRYADGDPAREVHQSPDWLRHEAVLLDSPFPYLERLGVIERRQTPLERLVDRTLSFSSVSQGRIGARAQELAREVRDLMATLAQDGMVAEVVESQALVARRAPTV
jgi:SAM-dependent methyltransferase